MGNSSSTAHCFEHCWPWGARNGYDEVDGAESSPLKAETVSSEDITPVNASSGYQEASRRTTNSNLPAVPLTLSGDRVSGGSLSPTHLNGGQPLPSLGPGLGLTNTANLPIGRGGLGGGLGLNTGNKNKSPQFHVHYELLEEIGVGSTSKCYRCRHKNTGEIFACKVIDKRTVEMKFSGLLDQFFVEQRVLETLTHPNIIRLVDKFESVDRMYMVMELMEGGELFDYVVARGTLSEDDASMIVRQIISAVAHMHSRNIIHRDLKPENLLLASPANANTGSPVTVKLIDFGLAKEMEVEMASSFLGTKGYLAPEMLQRHSYDKSIDMWALGVIVFVLLCGCLPFDDDSSRISSDAVAKKKFSLRFPKWSSNLSASAKDLLHNLLEVDPKSRFTAQRALEHPWVSGKTVNTGNLLQSPQVLSKNSQRSPLPPDYINNMSSRVHGTAAPAFRPGSGMPIPKGTAQYSSRGADMGRKNSF